MKPSLIILISLLLPSIANAGTARSELSNFSIQITGGTPILVSGQSKAYAFVELVSGIEIDSAEPLPPSGDFDLTADLFDATIHANSLANVDTSTTNAHFFSEVSGLGYAHAESIAYYILDVKAGTTITLTADAYGYSDPDYLRDIYRISSVLSIMDNQSQYIADGVYNYGNNAFYRAIPISLTYSAITNNRLIISAQTYIYNYGTVPEPKAYAMLIAGLALTGFFASRRRC